MKTQYCMVKNEMKCYVINKCVCLDVNIDKNIEQKIDNYLPLTAQLKRLYPQYVFEVSPVVVISAYIKCLNIFDNTHH